MSSLDLPKLARAAEAACDRARVEILPRFRKVSVEIKEDGSPVTEADRAAEHVLRAALSAVLPEAAILGEEFGAEGTSGASLQWVIDPIDGTIAFSRGIPLFGTLVALLEDGEPVLGVIDCCAISERTVGWKGGGCFLNGTRVRASAATDLHDAIVSHGDVFCFDRAGKRSTFERMAREIPKLRGYTDAFGHAHTCAGGIDAMVDLDLSPWDMAATRILITEAGGRWVLTPRQENGKSGIVFGAPTLVELLAGWLGLAA